MSNPFDQFDDPKSSNAFDQFDNAPAAPETDHDQVRRYMEDGRKRRLAEAHAAGIKDGNDMAMALPNALAGGIKTASNIGATLLAPTDMFFDAVAGRGVLDTTRDRRRKVTEGLVAAGANPESAPFKAGGLVTQVAATAGMGPALALGARSAGLSPAFVSALSSGGFRGGSNVAPGLPAAAANMGTRMAGGAVTGAAAAGLANPADAGFGAGIGALLPPALSGLGAAGGYLGRSARSLVEPFTANGQQRIAGRVLNRFAEGGPTTFNGREIIKGSSPTLAEATGNAGLAGLQRTARDVRPNSFVEREMANDAARTATFDDIAGDVGKLDFFRAERSQAAKQLYDDALRVVPPPPSPYLKGQVTQLLKRPSINEASKKAQQLALERGEKPYMNGSMPGLHDTKTMLDDMIEEATRQGKGGHAKALQATQEKLLHVMDELSPAYKEARTTYAAMSKPVNEMEALQGLKLTDQRGNMTLQKVQTAIGNLESQRGAAGFNTAKSIDADKLKTLYALRDDLLRKDKTNLGKSAGSNTYQNMATDNILGTLLPGKLGNLATGKLGAAAGQMGKLLYSGPNETIRNSMVDMMLDPAMAQRAMLSAQRLPGPAPGGFMDQTLPWIYRSGPAIGGDR